MNYRYYDEKYAGLLIGKCFTYDITRPIAIIHDGKDTSNFANLCYEYAKKIGYKEVYLVDRKNEEVDEYLEKTNLEDIKLNDILDKSILEELGKKHAYLLFVETYRENKAIDKAKQKKVNDIINEQLNYYYANMDNLKCPWCVACYPNRSWAKRVYPNLTIEKAYEKLYLNIIKMCHVNKENPEKQWEIIQKRYKEITEKLNELGIKQLHYQNSLGTNLKLCLPENHIWVGPGAKDYYGNDIILNMPSYEIFTSPLFDETEGTVYLSKPLHYKKIIDSFGLEFKKGAVKKIITESKEDKSALKDMISSDVGAKFLGECAIVENDTPVNLTKTIYYESLYDENASCHLALGNAYPDTIEDGLFMSEDDLTRNGLNISDIDVTDK